MRSDLIPKSRNNSSLASASASIERCLDSILAISVPISGITKKLGSSFPERNSTPLSDNSTWLFFSSIT